MDSLCRLDQDYLFYQQGSSDLLNAEDILYPSTLASPLLYTESIEFIPSIFSQLEQTPLFNIPVNLERRGSLSSSTTSSVSSDKTYTCQFKGCSKTFSRTYNLQSHHCTHTEDKPYVCQFCPKSFARQHDRNRHEKLHSGIKPHPCHFCHKSFARQDALNRHLKRDKKKDRSPDLFLTPPPCLILKFKKRQLAKKKKSKDLTPLHKVFQ